MAPPVTCQAAVVPGVGPDYNQACISGKFIPKSSLKTMAWYCWQGKCMIDTGFTGFLSFSKGMYVQVVRLSHLNAGTQYRLFFANRLIVMP